MHSEHPRSACGCVICFYRNSHTGLALKFSWSEWQRGAVICNSSCLSKTQNCAQKGKGFSLENGKGLLQTRDLLKLLRERRNILYKEHTATHMELLLSIPRWLQLCSSFLVWSLLPALAVRHLNWEFKLTHKVTQLPDLGLTEEEGTQSKPFPSIPNVLKIAGVDPCFYTLIGHRWLTPTGLLLMGRISPRTIPMCFHPFLPGVKTRQQFGIQC